MAKCIQILWFMVFLTVVTSSKLNVPHVLLPVFEEINANFMLEAANGGCYTWRTMRMDLVQLIPVNPDPILGCSRKAVVSAISKEKARNVAIVLAEEASTKLVLRVDVIVDVIHSLNISTTTKEIIMGEVPEVFKVVAFDSQGNQFTSLEGIEFDWKIICLGPKKDLTVLRFLTFKESPYETPAEIELFEKQNKRGHIVLLEGIKSGSTKVQVKLPYDEYTHVNICEVQLSIIANLIIIPADVYVMVGDVVPFKVFSMNNGNMEEIDLPSLQYYLEPESKQVASADPSKGEVIALKQGKTKIILHDRNADESDPGLKLPFAVLSVIEPAYLTINVMPYKNFEILVSNHHEIIVEAFSSNDNKLYLGPGVQLETQVGEIFHVEQRCKNGTWLSGWAKTEGIAPVQATLRGVIHSKLGISEVTPVTVKNDIHVYPHILLIPAEVILPWDPVSKPKYEVDISATGGDGKFLWTSSNHSVGAVNQNGNVKTHFHGYFEVSAAMQKNHHNRKSTKFHIVPPSRLEIVEFIMEAEVGSVLFLHVALFVEKPTSSGDAPSEVPFTHCQKLPFKVATTNNKFLRDKNQVIPPVGIGCATIAIIPHDVGTCKVTVQYVREGKTLEDNVIISAYNPLRLIHPTNEVVLAVGSSIPLLFKGGPLPNMGRFKRTVNTNDNVMLEAKDITDLHSIPGEDEFTVVYVLCRKLGTSEVILSVSNTPSIPNCKSKNAEISTRVTCGKPRSLFLQPAIKVADASSCPMDLSADRVVVQSNQDIELNVIVKDESGHRFLNISSLKFDWFVKPFELATLRSPDGTLPRLDFKGDLDLGSKSYQIVIPKTQVGQIIVKSTLIGYHSAVLRGFKITPEWPEFIDREEKGTEILPITAEIGLHFVDDIIVTPNETTIFNHPANKHSISVKQGSGYYELTLSNDNVAEIRYLEATREIIIAPIGPGELRINVVDLCLVSRPATVLITVVSVGAVRMEMSDKVELGKCIPCIVKLYDESDNLLNLPNVGMFDLQYDLESEITEVKKTKEEEGSPWPLGEIHYVVTGQELGDTKLTFSVSTTHNVITSAPIDLQVFSPLNLNPRNSTLIVGSYLQFSHKGGPQPDSHIEYSVSSKNIAEIIGEGVLQALKLGQVKVHARATGINPASGQKLIYTQDVVDVTVIPLTGIRIMTPLTRFQLGASVPVWVTGIPEQLSPIILGTVTPSFVFKWALDEPDIIEIQGVFQKIGIQYSLEDQISIRLTGVKPGKTKLHLNVTVPGVTVNCPKKQFVTLTDTVDLEIFERLILTFPSQVSGLPILLAPHSSLQLQTNMDSLHRIRYKLLEEGTPGDRDLQISPSISNPVVTVSDTGVLTSHENLGYAMVLIISTDEYGLKQSLSVIVKVKTIHYMMLNIISNWRVPMIDVIPVGTEFELRATYHDNTGNTFTAGSADLHVRTSRLDLAKVRPGIDNSSVFISVKKPGQMILKVWADGVKKTADYIKLHFKQTITPLMDHLVTGDIVCFWTPVSSKNSGLWSSSDPTLLTVDDNTGMGRVVGTKGGYVTVSNSLHPIASVQFQILPIMHMVFIERQDGQILTNARNAEIFHIPLLFTSEVKTDKTNNFVNGCQCKNNVTDIITSFPFKCSIRFSNESSDISADSIFTVRSSFIPEKGLYSCDLISTGLNSPIVSTLNTNVILKVEVSNNIISEPMEIRFLPAMYLNNELSLDPQTYTAELLVVSSNDVLNEVSVTPSDANLLQVYEGERTSHLLSHKIRLLDYHWKLNELKNPLYLNVNSKLTGENVKVAVQVQGGDRFHRPECAVTYGIGTFFYNNRQSLAILASMIVIFFVTFYAYSNYVQPVINVNVTPTHSLLSSPVGTGVKSCVDPNQCNAVAYMQNLRRSPQTTYVGNTSLNTSSTSSPVYGDPASFYSTSPELRRNRRFM